MVRITVSIIALTVLIVSLLTTGLIYMGTTSPNRSATIITDYFELRSRFRKAADNLGGKREAFTIAASGPGGEGLTIDTAWFGPENPANVILHISGTHGIEGAVGSAIQTKIIEKGIKITDPNTAVVFIHGLNPWGMAHLRRANESNVDLNRNFLIDPGKFTGAPEGYRNLNSFLNPEGFPKRIDTFFVSAAFNIVRYGFSSVKQAIAGGQYEFKKGLFYGGSQMEESLAILRRFVEERFRGVKKLYAIEIHTGLGSWGEDVVFWNLPADHEKSKKLVKIIHRELTSDAADKGVGFTTPGDLQDGVPRLIPAADTYWLVQEFGAYGPVTTLRALRDENRFYHAGGNDLSHWSKQRFLEVFVPGDNGWQQQVVTKGVELFDSVVKSVNG